MKKTTNEIEILFLRQTISIIWVTQLSHKYGNFQSHNKGCPALEQLDKSKL